MRIRRWQWSALAGALVVAAGAVAWFQLRVRPLGAPIVTPPPGRMSMKIGDVTVFKASAESANHLTWSVWGRAMSHAANWSYVPGPEDAGWQQISVQIVGDDDQRAVRTWDIGVVPAVPPELTDIWPAPGVVAIPAGQPASFRATAHVAAARAEDRLIFEWSVDGRLVLREERSEGRGASEFALPSADPGSHRIIVRVSEGKRSASLAEWALDVAPPTLPQVAVLPPLGKVPPVQPPPTPPLAPRVVRLPGPRAMTVELGEAVSLGIGIEPADAGAAFRWTVDGKRVASASKPKFDYEPGTPGRHRVAVNVVFGERSVGGDAWFVRVGEPDEVAEAKTVTSSTVHPAEAVPTTETATAGEMVAAATIPAQGPAVVARAPSALESDVRAWLAEYASAWSRKDVATLRSMGQVRTPNEIDKLERYFRSVGDLRVDVRVLSVTVDGDHASVEFERTDTVTDPSGRQQELRLPPIRKEIERTPDGLRFTIVSTQLKGVL